MHSFLEAVGANRLLALEVASVPWLIAPSSSKPKKLHLSDNFFPLSHLPSEHSRRRLSAFEDPCDDIGSTGSSLHLKVLNLATSTKSSLPRKAKYPQALEMRTGTFGCSNSACHNHFPLVHLGHLG